MLDAGGEGGTSGGTVNKHSQQQQKRPVLEKQNVRSGKEWKRTTKRRAHRERTVYLL